MPYSGNRLLFRNKKSVFLLLLLLLVVGGSCTSSPASRKISRKASQLGNSKRESGVLERAVTQAGKPLVKEGDSIVVVRSDGTSQVIQVVLNGDAEVVTSTIPSEYHQKINGLIVRVSDGDTVVLLDEDETQHRVRLDGIDCPEKKQAYGNKATQFVRDKIGNKNATVYYNKKDQYGRILGVVVTQEGENVNELLLANGLAWHYKHYNDNPIYAQLEQKAKDQRLNIWSEKNPIEPYLFRKMQREKSKQRKESN